MKKVLITVLVVAMLLSTVTIGALANENLPEAVFERLTPVTLTATDNYTVYPNGDSTIDRPLNVVVKFAAIDTAETVQSSPYKDYITDFNLTFNGLTGDSFVADECYLAGNYGEYGWWVIPVDGETVPEGEKIPVMGFMNMELPYSYICTDVKEMTCAIYIDEAVIEANPDMTVTLDLIIRNPENNQETIINSTTYDADNLLGNVAKVNGVKYTDIQAAIKAAAPAGTVELLSDVTVDEWIMFAENLTIGNGDLITLNINGLTINGNGKTLTVNSIESAGNGGRLFYDAAKLNIKDLTIKYADGLDGAIGLKTGTIENVTFDGCTYGVMPQTGDVKIINCTFKTKGTSVYFEEERDGLAVTGCTFENPSTANVILLRGAVTFTDNIIKSGRTVNVVSGSPVVTGNDFNDVRFKVYNVATATIENNEINNLLFNDASEVKSTFADNTLSEAAQTVFDAAKFPGPVKVTTYEELIAALAKDNANVIMMNDITATATQSNGYGKTGIVVEAGDVLDGNGKTLTINGANSTWDSVIGMRGGEVKNLTIAGAMRGVFMPGANGDVVIDNCVFKDVVYTFNSDAGSKDYTVTIKNSALNGWTSFSNVHKSVTFENCTFGEGSGYAYCRPYQPTEFNGCDFGEDYGLDASPTAANSLVFNDCTYDGAPLSADNGWQMFSDGGDVIIDGEEVRFINSNDVVACVGNTAYDNLKEALNAAVTAGEDVTVEILTDIDLEGVDWTPVSVNGAVKPAAHHVTVNGNNHKITHLNNMLFSGTWAGKSGLIINDLTIADSNIVTDKDDTAGTVGVGAFIGYPQASETITLNNCHLIKSTVEGGHWTGGLIGMAGGYNGNDGPVFMNLTITGCSVKDSVITGKGSVGGLMGHASCAAWTKVVVENTVVSGNTVTSTGSSNEKAGAVFGTVGAAGQETTADGETKIGGQFVAATVKNNTVTSNGTTITTIYGRQGTNTGKLELTGGSYDHKPISGEESWAGIKAGFALEENADGTYSVEREYTITLSADGGKYADGTAAIAFNAFFMQWESQMVDAFGMYIYKQSDKFGAKVSINTNAGNTLTEERGLFNAVVTAIPADANDNYIVCLPYVIVDGNTIAGEAKAVTASQFSKILAD